jgi:hypothetical protein
MTACKACPFCGLKRVVVYETWHPAFTVECDRCGASGPQAATEEASIAWWNELPRAANASKTASRLAALRRVQRQADAERKREQERREAPKRKRERSYAKWAAARKAWLSAPVDEVHDG